MGLTRDQDSATLVRTSDASQRGNPQVSLTDESRYPETEYPYDDRFDELVEREEIEEEFRQTVTGFDPDDCSGVFDGFGVVSDADPGL
jgi:hypothetical protein